LKAIVSEKNPWGDKANLWAEPKGGKGEKGWIYGKGQVKKPKVRRMKE